MDEDKNLFDAIKESDLEAFGKTTSAPPVPYIVHEGEVARLERIIKKLWILCILLFLSLVISNAGWIVYESQFVDEITVTQDTPGGNNNYVGRDGSITNGAASDKENPDS